MSKNNIALKALLISVLSISSIFSNNAADLFSAVSSNNFTLVKKVVEKAENLNELKNGTTVLDIAVEKSNKKIARYLLKNGAKVTTDANVIILKSFLEKRAFGFLLGGFLLSPLMWIGSYNALSDMSLVLKL